MFIGNSEASSGEGRVEQGEHLSIRLEKGSSRVIRAEKDFCDEAIRRNGKRAILYFEHGAADAKTWGERTLCMSSHFTVHKFSTCFLSSTTHPSIGNPLFRSLTFLSPGAAAIPLTRIILDTPFILPSPEHAVLVRQDER